MKAMAVRGMGILCVMLCLFAVSPARCQGSAVLWSSLMLTALYTWIRPLMQTLILPLNLFLAGLLTPLTDALLIVWTSGWVHGLSLGYWEGVLLSLAIGIAYLPYSRGKERRTSAGMVIGS